MRTSSNYIRLKNMSTHRPGKKHASSRINKNGRSMCTGKKQNKNISVREKTKVTDVIEQVQRRKWTWAGLVSMIRDNRWTLRITSWKRYERRRLRRTTARWWRNEIDDYWKLTESWSFSTTPLSCYQIMTSVDWWRVAVDKLSPSRRNTFSFFAVTFRLLKYFSSRANVQYVGITICLPPRRNATIPVPYSRCLL